MLQFLGRLPLVAAEFREQRDNAGVDAADLQISFLPLVAAHQQPAGAARQIGHVSGPLIGDQVQAGAQAIPTLLERRDAELRLLISRAMVPAESASCISRIRSQTTAFNNRNGRPETSLEQQATMSNLEPKEWTIKVANGVPKTSVLVTVPKGIDGLHQTVLVRRR